MATKDDVLTETDDDIDVVEVDTAAGEEAKAAEAEAAKAAEGGKDGLTEDEHDEDEDGEQEDARLAERDEGEDPNREDNPERKKRLNRRRAAKARTERLNAEVDRLTRQVAELTRGQTEIRNTNLSVSEGMVTSRLEQVRQDIATAEAILADAVKNADGDSYTTALRLRDEAKAQESELVVAQKGFVEAKKAPATADTEATRLAGEWKRANATWYGSNAAATASANAIDAALSAEGLYSHGSPDYYRELTRRVTTHFNGGERTERKPETQTDTRAKGPKLGDRGGGANGAPAGRKVFLSKDRVDAIKAAGDWDDPKERAKAIRAYEEYDREQSAQR